MGDRCDARTNARAVAQTPRQRELVEELMHGRWVLIETESGNPRVGLSGLGWPYWRELRYRLEEWGFQFIQSRPYSPPNEREYIKMFFPGEVVR